MEGGIGRQVNPPQFLNLFLKVVVDASVGVVVAKASANDEAILRRDRHEPFVEQAVNISAKK